jgi:hypothetical protein
MSTEPQKFRKKPVVIEAQRYCWNPGVIDGLMEWGCPVEPTEHWMGACGEEGHEENADVYIPTLEGKMLCQSLNSDGTGGDWIIRGVKGEFYPCKPDIFDATYEPA